MSGKMNWTRVEAQRRLARDPAPRLSLRYGHEVYPRMHGDVCPCGSLSRDRVTRREWVAHRAVCHTA